MANLIEVRSLLDHKYGAYQKIEPSSFDPEVHVMPEDFKEKKPKLVKKAAVKKEELSE